MGFSNLWNQFSKILPSLLPCYKLSCQLYLIFFSWLPCSIKLSYSSLYIETFYQNFLTIALYRLSKAKRLMQPANSKRTKRPQSEKVPSAGKRNALNSKTKQPASQNEASAYIYSFENAGNQLICMDCANFPLQLKFYKQNSISRRHYCFLSS